MLSEKNVLGKKKEKKCINCGVEVSQKEYCVGCGKYICTEHRVNVVVAFGHSPEDHTQLPLSKKQFHPMD